MRGKKRAVKRREDVERIVLARGWRTRKLAREYEEVESVERFSDGVSRRYFLWLRHRVPGAVRCTFVLEVQRRPRG